MSRTLNLQVDPAGVSMAAAVRQAARVAPLLVVKQRAFADLAAELGSMEAAVGELLSIAESVNRPIAVSVPTGEDMSSTVFISPRGWTEERLVGWVGGHHQELERQFGEVTRMGNRAQRHRRRREGRS